MLWLAVSPGKCERRVCPVRGCDVRADVLWTSALKVKPAEARALFAKGSTFHLLARHHVAFLVFPISCSLKPCRHTLDKVVFKTRVQLTACGSRCALKG